MDHPGRILAPVGVSTKAGIISSQTQHFATVTSSSFVTCIAMPSPCVPWLLGSLPVGREAPPDLFTRPLICNRSFDAPEGRTARQHEPPLFERPIHFQCPERARRQRPETLLVDQVLGCSVV